MFRIHLGTILGTTITVDITFILIVVLFILNDLQTAGMPQALLWAPVLFISILVHELAHAAMIGILGFGGSQIVLEGIGGATINERRARHWQDLLISAAGPAASFALAYGFAFLLFRVPVMRSDPFFASLLPVMVYANILWGKFNLMPVIPLDGSSVLRNFLRMILSEKTAFIIAVWVSIVVGILLAIYGLRTRNFFLAILMIWFVRGSWLQWQFYQSNNRTDD